MRARRQQDSPADELNLAPIMNLVIILIPMLLLSVVFLSVGVFNVSAPSMCAVSCSKTATSPQPLGLQVTVTEAGFVLSVRGRDLAPIAGCPDDGATICLAPGQAKPDWAMMRGLYARGDQAHAQRALDRAIGSYPFHKLYNTLARLKRDHPDETKVLVSAEADVPYAAVVRVIDTARFKLARERYDDATAFLAANYGPTRKALFPDPTFMVTQ